MITAEEKKRRQLACVVRKADKIYTEKLATAQGLQALQDHLVRADWTIKSAGDFLGVSTVIVRAIIQRHEDVADLFASGRASIVRRARRSLADRAFGLATSEETKAVYEMGADGKERCVSKVVTTKKLAPDITALFGLLNIYDPTYVMNRAQFLIDCEKNGIDADEVMQKAGVGKKKNAKATLNRMVEEKKAQEGAAASAAPAAVQPAEDPSAEAVRAKLMAIADGDYRNVQEAKLKTAALTAVLASKQKAEKDDKDDSQKEEDKQRAELRALLTGIGLNDDDSDRAGAKGQ